MTIAVSVICGFAVGILYGFALGRKSIGKKPVYIDPEDIHDAYAEFWGQHDPKV